ncbi:CHAT domain-containing protein [uncultured Tenacibaculum sp.]|uniref:CHAT domain-containing protein n=1 Tax=uncultured Tenacibaculum sp. TaxID=174713 RepID=UPI002618C070|nr:CHAT domain-containing protein [uncultured Tenacibaculum sp.]
MISPINSLKDRVIIILFTLFINTLSFTQETLSIEDIKNLSYNKKIDNKLVDSLISKEKNFNDKKNLYHNFSRFFRVTGNNKLAIKYGNKELDYFEKLKLKNKKYHIALHLIGCYYHDNGQYEKAIEALKKSTNLNIYPKKSAQSLCMLGSCFRAKGDIKKSLDYYKKGINSLKKLNNKKSIITHSINLALTCNFSNNTSEIKDGVNYLLKADSLIKNYSNSIVFLDIFNINNSLGNLYSKSQIFNFQKSKHHYLKSLKISEKEKNPFFISLASMNYGELLLKTKSDSSIFYLKKSLNQNIKKNQNYTILSSEIHRNISNYFFWKNDLIKALESINTSLKISLDLNKNDTYPSRIQLLKTTDRLNISKALNTKIKVLNQLYLKNKDSKYLTQIIETVNISDQLIEIILEDSTEASTQFSWRNDVSKIYNYGVYAAKLLGDDNLQFQYLEKNKAFLLTQSINDNNYSLNLPNHIVNEELRYKKQILQLENQVSNTETKQLKDSLFDIKFAYQNFKDSIQKVYPQHFESKAKVKLTSLQNVRQQIDDKTVVVSYAIQDDETTTINISSGLLITKDKTIPFSIANVKKLKDDLHVYRQLISKPLSSKKEIQQYNTIANSLYNSLFPSEEVKNLIQNKKVVIIPDDNLQNIPFEAFITDTTSNRFLIEDTDISYAYSMSFLNVNNNISRVSEKDFAGFAPIEFQNKNLATLQYSAEEINSINANLNGTTFTGADVTKDSFFTNASNAKIIHLATHADVSQKPVIHFSKDSLNLHELYTYKNNADLVVLSACETNVGELKKGEGILNLARGFFYSGSKSVVSSLWKVNDAATTELMTDFYTNLKDHQSKSEALNNAKRKYLKTHSLSEKSPYYWASFILIGDTAPTFENSNLIYWGLISVAIFSLFLILFFKKIKSK